MRSPPLTRLYDRVKMKTSGVVAAFDTVIQQSQNEDVKEELSGVVAAFDTVIQQSQNEDVKEKLSGMVAAFDTVIQQSQNEDVKEKFSDRVALRSNASNALDVVPRQLFRGEIKEEYNSLCHVSYPITGFLFGPNISDKLKEMNDTLSVSRFTRRFQPFKRGNKSFPFIGQR